MFKENSSLRKNDSFFTKICKNEKVFEYFLRRFSFFFFLRFCDLFPRFAENLNNRVSFLRKIDMFDMYDMYVIHKYTVLGRGNYR